MVAMEAIPSEGDPPEVDFTPIKARRWRRPWRIRPRRICRGGIVSGVRGICRGWRGDSVCWVDGIFMVFILRSFSRGRCFALHIAYPVFIFYCVVQSEFISHLPYYLTVRAFLGEHHPLERVELHLPAPPFVL